jgi:hypothetical protein
MAPFRFVSLTWMPASSGALLDATEPRIDETGTSSPVTAPVPLRSLSVVAAHIPFIESARATVTAEMESTILAGLTHLVCLSLMHVRCVKCFSHHCRRTKPCLLHPCKLHTTFVFYLLLWPIL